MLDYVAIPHPSYVITLCVPLARTAIASTLNTSCGMSTALCSSLLDPLSPLGTGWGLWGKTVMCPHHHRHPDSQNWWKLILPRVEEPLKVSLGRPTVCVSHPFRQNHRHLIKMSKPVYIHVASFPGSKDNTDGRRREKNWGIDQKSIFAHT